MEHDVCGKNWELGGAGSGIVQDSAIVSDRA